MLSQKAFERIESYLTGTMDAAAEKAFEQELHNNPPLRKSVETQRKLMLAVETAETRNRLETIHQKIASKKTATRWWMAAASMAVLIAISLWLFTKPDKAEKLFAANFTTDPGLPVPMSAANNYDFYDAMVDYKSENYVLALQKWNQLLLANPENDTLNYYTGAALFNDEKYREAIPYFEKVILLDSPGFSGKAEWYLALSFLQTGEFARLEKLAQQSSSSYASRIKQLNQKLD